MRVHHIHAAPPHQALVLEYLDAKADEEDDDLQELDPHAPDPSPSWDWSGPCHDYLVRMATLPYRLTAYAAALRSSAIHV